MRGHDPAENVTVSNRHGYEFRNIRRAKIAVQTRLRVTLSARYLRSSFSTFSAIFSK